MEEASRVCTQCGVKLGPNIQVCPLCGHEEGVEAELQLGTRLGGRYELVEELGAGGMGVVFKAVQHPLGNEVCVKALHRHIVTDDPSFAARFEREAKTLAGLRHPNIVAVLDYNADPNPASYIVMEYVEGGNLRDLLKNSGPMKAGRAVRIVGQICAALSAAHAKGVIHRDLKPSNIMVTSLPGTPDFVKVLDFGSALIVSGEQDDRLTRAGAVIGTPVYMAPEYIMGHAIDPRVDVYAVGVMLYVLLCGEPPFRGATQALFAQHVRERPPRPSEKNPKADVSPQMEWAIMRALEKDPSRRYDTADAFKEAIEEALARADDRLEMEISLDDAIDAPEPLDAASGAAAPQRHVAIVVARGVHGLPEAVGYRLINLASSRKAIVQAGRTAVAMGFVVDSDAEDAVHQAARFAAAAAKTAGQSVRLGLHVGPWTSDQPLTDMDADEAARVRERANGLAVGAVPGQVLVAESSAVHLSELSQLRPAAPLPGVDEPVFDVVGADPALQLRHRLSFVGRDLERRALLDLASKAREGPVCLVTGAEGVGKSRLVEEVSDEADRMGVLWAVVPASPHQKRGFAHPAALLAVRGLKSRQSSAGGTSTAVADLLHGRTETTTKTGIQGQVAQDRLVTAAIGWLVDRASEGPVVIVLDDLQEADDLTIALARRLVQMARSMGAAVVLCAREPANVPIWLPDDATRLSLGPLPDEQVRTMVSESLQADADERVVGLATELARGVPLVVHLAMPFLESKNLSSLDRVRKRCRTVDETVRELILHRLEGLSREASSVLNAAAVAGYESSEREVLAIAGAGEAGEASIDEMSAAEAILRMPGGRLRFPFPTLWRVALEGVPPAEGARLHAAAAETLAASEGVEVRALEIGEHFLEAGDKARACEHLAKAAELAEAEGEFREAMWCLQLVATSCSELGEAHVERELAAYRDLARVLMQLRQADKAEAILRTGIDRAEEASRPAVQAELLLLLGETCLIAGEPQAARRCFETARDIASVRRELVLVAAAHGCLADVLEQEGETQAVADSLREGLGILRERKDSAALEARMKLLKRLARLAKRTSNHSAAVAALTDALHIAELKRDRYEMANILGDLGSAYARKKVLDKAGELTDRALKLSEELGDLVGVSRQLYNMALIHLHGGKRESAAELLEQSRAAAIRAGWHKGFAVTQAALQQLAGQGG